MGGLSLTWTADREYRNYQEVEQHRQQHRGKVLVHPSFFPPNTDEDYPLEHCIRLLPHLNNSGGFFVALFKKTAPLHTQSVSHQHPTNQNPEDNHSRPTDDTVMVTEGEERGTADSVPIAGPPDEGSQCEHDHQKLAIGEMDQEGMTQSLQTGLQHFKGIDPIFCMDDHPIVHEVSAFYGVEGIDLGRNLISRNLNNDEPRKVYFVSSAVKDLIASGWDRAVRMTSLGQKVMAKFFQRREGTPYKCVYRFCQEGLPLVLPYITKQKLFLKTEAMARFLEQRCLRIPNPAQSPNSPDIVQDSEIVDGISRLEQGGCVVLLDDTEAISMGLPTSPEAGGSVPVSE